MEYVCGGAVRVTWLPPALATALRHVDVIALRV
jgi:hypothetical protein